MLRPLTYEIKHDLHSFGQCDLLIKILNNNALKKAPKIPSNKNKNDFFVNF